MLTFLVSVPFLVLGSSTILGSGTVHGCWFRYHSWLRYSFCSNLYQLNLPNLGETGVQWIRNLLFQYITDPLRAIGIF